MESKKVEVCGSYGCILMDVLSAMDLWDEAERAGMVKVAENDEIEELNEKEITKFLKSKGVKISWKYDANSDDMSTIWIAEWSENDEQEQ